MLCPEPGPAEKTPQQTRDFNVTKRPRLALCLGAALLLAACASSPKLIDRPATSSGAQSQTPPPGLNAGSDWDAGAVAAPRAMQQQFAEAAGDRVFFDLDSFALTGEAREALARQAARLIGNPSVRVLVAGNCDERGTREYNFALGARRAAAAATFLAARGVASDRLRTISYGKERPLETAADDAAWSKNRNAQTVLIDLGAR